MSPRQGALVRTALLLLLLALSVVFDPLPAWWWAVLVAVLVWTLADFVRWAHEEESDD